MVRIKSGASRLWLYLLIPPLAAVVGSVFTIYLALTYPDPLVHTNAQRLGKVMVEDRRSALAAQTLQLTGRLSHATESGILRLVLQGDELPATVQLLWLHPTRTELDLQLVLHATEQHVDRAIYRGELLAPALYHGTWVIQDTALTWMLESTAVDSAGEILLNPVLR